MSITRFSLFFTLALCVLTIHLFTCIKCLWFTKRLLNQSSSRVISLWWNLSNRICIAIKFQLPLRHTLSLSLSIFHYLTFHNKGRQCDVSNSFTIQITFLQWIMNSIVDKDDKTFYLCYWIRIQNDIKWRQNLTTVEFWQKWGVCVCWGECSWCMIVWSWSWSMIIRSSCWCMIVRSGSVGWRDVGGCWWSDVGGCWWSDVGSCWSGDVFANRGNVCWWVMLNVSADDRRSHFGKRSSNNWCVWDDWGMSNNRCVGSNVRSVRDNGSMDRCYRCVGDGSNWSGMKGGSDWCMVDCFMIVISWIRIISVSQWVTSLCLGTILVVTSSENGSNEK